MSLYSIFPPPEYLEMPVIGLDISDRSLKFLSFKRVNGKIRLDKFGKKDMPEGIIAGGIIKKRDELVAFLSDNRKKLGIRYAVVSLPEEKAFLHVAQLPAMNEDNIRETIEMQLEGLVPITPSDTAFDFKILPTGEDKTHMDVLIAAYSRMIIGEYNAVLREAGITPLAFEIEAQSMARAVVSKNEQESVMIIDFGKTRTSFLIVSGGELRFTSTINVAGGSLDAAIAKSLNIDLYAAEHLKHESGSVSNNADDKVAAAILPVATAIKEEAEKNLGYWEGHAAHLHAGGGTKIKKILLCGGDANLRGLPEFLSGALKIKTELANVWENVAPFEEYVPELDRRESMAYATAVGLGLKALEV
jgi:type IV pilus assembly protein PilM